MASYNGHLKVIKELLARGAAIDVTNSAGDTSLHGASERGHLEVVQELLAQPLDVVEELIAQGANVHAEDTVRQPLAL
ncbi:hypothetical protein AC1031_014012 [Aphanomyces cochlioides]|nr:hypothetical protein AC1031_014012 [Aphanomyces cochlioides]